jgi:hypothetical protein
MIRVTLVGNRGGRASISWWGVALASALVASIAVVGVAVFGLAVGWHSPAAYVPAIAMSVVIVIGSGISQGFHTPPERLIPL